MSLPPHGLESTLKDLLRRDSHLKAKLEDLASTLPSIVLTDRQLCDLELIMNGGFSPLEGFMDEADYQGVVSDMRLRDGTLWPMPVYLDVSENLLVESGIKKGVQVVLRDNRDDLALAILSVGDIYRPNKNREAELVFGKNDRAHPSVAYLFDRVQEFYLGGKIQAIQAPAHYDYQSLRSTPQELRDYFVKLNWTRM